MKLTNEEKCTYCREYGNLPCKECDKKLESKKAMSKTKFTKVAVRLPGKEYVFLTPSMMSNRPQEKEFIEPFWAEESPDREDEMREMLEKLKSSHSELYRRLNQANNVYKIDTPSIKKALEIAEKLNQKYSKISDNDKLLQSLKQEK